MDASRLEVVVIGAGFSGTSVAMQLLRMDAPMRVRLVNRFGPPGRGVAYGTRFEAHLLNVPADRMSALPEDSTHFLRFAQSRDPSIEAGSFVPRGLYGEYLEASLQEARRAASASVSFETVVDEVIRVDALPDTDLRLVCRGRDSIRADVVVLALGNYAPADPPIPDASFYRSERYVRDPWVPGALDRIRSRDRVLIIGTGLTMMDIALDLRGKGVAAPVHAVSPRGLLPRPHAPGAGRAVPDSPALDPKRAAPGLRGYVKAFRAQLASATEAGADWRDMVASIRSRSPKVWSNFSMADRARFIRHVRPYWDVHRHRAPPQTAAAIRTMFESGRLRVVAGRIRDYGVLSDGVRVTIKERGATATRTIVVDHVLNCTGPDSDVRRIQDPLIRSLVDDGRLRPDPLGLGIAAQDDGRVLDRHERPSPAMFLVGPLLKATHWEATAVPELRAHASIVAGEIAELARTRACSAL